MHMVGWKRWASLLVIMGGTLHDLQTAGGTFHHDLVLPVWNAVNYNTVALSGGLPSIWSAPHLYHHFDMYTVRINPVHSFFFSSIPF